MPASDNETISRPFAGAVVSASHVHCFQPGEVILSANLSVTEHLATDRLYLFSWMIQMSCVIVTVSYTHLTLPTKRIV